MSTFTLASYTVNDTNHEVLHHTNSERTKLFYANHGISKHLNTLTEFDVPASNLLMIALGWAGGTIHMVASETGLTVQEIIDLEHVKPVQSRDEITPYGFGMMYGTKNMEQYKGNVQFWRGVLENTIQYKKSKINYKLYLN